MASEGVLIYGGGISGMVAAYNLARQGHDVVVREKEAGFGGWEIFDPSTHTTPLDLEATSEYIGIDISPAFHPVSSLSVYLHDFRLEMPVFMAYHVERSSREESLDFLLYEKCREAGVSFEFERPLEEGEIDSPPRDGCRLRAKSRGVRLPGDSVPARVRVDGPGREGVSQLRLDVA